MAFGNTANAENGGGKKPVHEEKVGGIRTSTWENDSKNGKFYTTTLQRCYKDGEEFKYTGSLRVNDLPKAILALQKAYEKMVVADSSE